MAETHQNRYSRHILLPEIGQSGQEKLSAARVLVIGAGGLGCPALQYLAATGVGTIGIVDSDTVDESNLQRQILFTTAQIEQSKALAARERLLALNPHIGVRAYNEELTADNALGLFADYDVIVDGTDNFAAKFLINDAAVKLGKPVIYGAVQGFEGQVAVFDAQRGACYRCLYPTPPKAQIMNCAEAGIVGALAGIIGSMQAMEAIKLIVGHESFEPLIGRLWSLDAKTGETTIFQIPKRSDCPTCATVQEDIVLSYQSAVCSVPEEIGVDEFLRLNGAVVIDVREREEWNAGHWDGAEFFPLSAIVQGKNPTMPDDAKAVVLYCAAGVRSRRACSILRERGFKNLINLRGGYNALKAARSNPPAR